MDNTDSNRKQGALHKKVDIPLFHAVLALAAETSTDDDAMKHYSDILENSIWGKPIENYGSVLEQYSLRYVGEILQRYEEKIGTDICHFRAIALAIGYATPFLTESMFIGTQREDFIKKLKQEEQDVFLLGAQYLLFRGTKQGDRIFRKLSQTQYHRTEEALFTLSILENKDEGFDIMRSQVARLLGIDRTVDVEKDIELFEWLIAQFLDQIQRCRKKDNAILRAWTKVPTMYVKEGNQVYKILEAAGYSKKEIIYANSHMIWNTKHPKRLNPESIPGEKVATEFCITYLNDAETNNNEILKYLEELFQYYKYFAIHYKGYAGLWNAVVDRLELKNPYTAAWLINNIRDGYIFLFDFDVFSTTWDALVSELGPSKYRMLYTHQLVNVKEEAKIKQYLERFKALTGQDYRNVFLEDGYIENGEELFELFVEKDIINLWEYFQSYIKPQGKCSDVAVSYLLSYCKGATTRKSFEFWKTLFDVEEEFTIYFGEGFRFYRGFYEPNLYYRQEDINIKRDFLNDEELRQLFEWIETSVYFFDPASYSDFCELTLKNEYLIHLFGKSEMCCVLNKMIQLGQIEHDKRLTYQELLYTPEEWANAKQEEMDRKKELKRQRELQSQEKIKKELEAAFDGTIESLEEAYMYIHTSERALKLQAVADKLEGVLQNEVLGHKEVGAFLKLSAAIVSQGIWPISKVIDYLLTCKEDDLCEAND